jgi:hypothetical protein
MSVSSFNSTINNTFKSQKFSEENNSETFNRGIFAGRDIDRIKKPVSNLNKGKSFWKMSLTQKFVFGLGLISGVGGSNVVQKNSETCELSNVCSSKTLATSTTFDLPVCEQFSFLEQVGKINIMPNFPLKKSDEIRASFKFNEREYLTISKKFTDIAEDLHCIQGMQDILTKATNYITSHCQYFKWAFHDKNSGVAYKMCFQYKLTKCMADNINGLESYQSAIAEIIKFMSESYEASRCFENNLEDIVSKHEIYVAKLFDLLFKTTSMMYEDLRESSKNIEPAEQEGFYLHYQHVKAILDKSKIIYKKCKPRDTFKTPLKDMLKKNNNLFLIEYNQCFIDSYLQETTKLLAIVKEQREKIRYFFPDDTNKVKKYILSGLYSMYSLGGLFATSLTTYSLFNKFIKTKYKKPNIDLILKQLVIKKIDDFDQKIKQCERVSQNNIDFTKKAITMPNNWFIPRLEIFTEKTTPSHNIKKNKKLSSNYLMSEKQKNTKDASHIIQEIPKYPWQDSEICFDDPHIKPIINHNENIVAYAYFNDESLDKKFTKSDIKKMQEIHTAGRMTPHLKNSTGYKVFQYKKQQIWEFKIAGNNRLYGVPIKANNKEQKIKIAPLVIFDMSLRKKLGGDD